MDFKRRLEGLQKSMDEFDIDLVVFGSCQNFQYLTGLLLEWRRMRDIIPREDNVFVPKEGSPILTLAEYSSLEDESCWIEDVRVLEKNDSYRELVEKIALDLGWRSGNIAIGENLKSATWFEVNSIFKEARFCNGKFLMDKIRMIKEPDEIRKLREVASLTDNTMESVNPTSKNTVVLDFSPWSNL